MGVLLGHPKQRPTSIDATEAEVKVEAPTAATEDVHQVKDGTTLAGAGVTNGRTHQPELGTEEVAENEVAVCAEAEVKATTIQRQISPTHPPVFDAALGPTQCDCRAPSHLVKLYKDNLYLPSIEPHGNFLEAPNELEQYIVSSPLPEVHSASHITWKRHPADSQNNGTAA